MADNPSKIPPGRVNLALLVVLLVLTIVYFRLHLREWVTGFALLGGTFTLWSLWKLVQTLLGDWAGFDPQALTFRLLGRPRAREHLIFALCILVILFAITSSIYVEQNAAVGSHYSVDVLRDGEYYVEPIEVSSTDRIAGRPFFFAGWRELEFRVVAKPDFRTKMRTVEPWTAVRIGRFEEKQLFILRVVLGLTLRNRLPGPDDQPEVSYVLRVKADGHGEKFLDDLRRGTVLLGAGRQDLEHVDHGHDREGFARFLTEYFVRKGVPSDRQVTLLVDYQRQPQVLPSAELTANQGVELSVGRVLEGAHQEWIACQEVHMNAVGADRVQKVVLEAGGCDQDES